MTLSRPLMVVASWAGMLIGQIGALSAEDSIESASSSPASYYRQVLPILQANCQGCHQSAKANGGYVMTSFDKLVRGGESEMAGIVPGKPDESYLLELITPEDGQAEMPFGRPPLSSEAIALIRQWIAEGAHNDSPATTQAFDAQHPPSYASLPVITAIDYSPDGQYLAVAGFHEVLLHKFDGSEIVARLVGISERIQSVAFSPDGKQLAVAGGLPARSGELQVWNVGMPADGTSRATPSLAFSIPITGDTVYGGSWSPDGQLIALGCADNSVRAFDAESGQQVLFQGAHSDWVLDTAFSVDGSHLISVGRDMAAKLIDVGTERFVDNITSITPGALKGGILSVARHPARDEIVIGGADGIPKVYRIFRQTERRIGDDANLIRRLPALTGRIFAVAVSTDGRRIASGSSLDGRGQVAIDSYEFDTSLPEDIKQISSKVVTERSADENRRLEEYNQSGLQRLALVEMPSAVYALDFHPDGSSLAVAGSDGVVRIVDVEQGSLAREFAAVPTNELMAQPGAEHRADVILFPEDHDQSSETLPLETQIRSLMAEPARVLLSDCFDYVQVVVIATLTSGERIDVTRMVQAQFTADVARITPSGTVQPLRDGQADLRLDVGGHGVVIPVSVTGLESPFQPDYLRDITPVITKLGCNQGTCHGAAQGKNGFKLSLRGYDAMADLRALTDDHASRRANTASPADSLMLLKATATVPHMGGQLMKPGDPYYQVLHDWLAGGSRLNAALPRVTSVSVFPQNPVVESIDSRQQVRVVATYGDGRTRDVTREAFVTSGNTDVATVDARGLLTALRRGEAPILARYQGCYAATTLTVMGERAGFVWEDPPVFNRIDELVATKWKRLKLQPSPLCDDAEFIRRVSLDLTGLPPTADATRAFVHDPRETRVKREALVDTLIGSPAFVDYWTNKWADLLDVNRKFLGAEGAAAYRDWIRQQVADNQPYDAFVRNIVTASGSNRENPPAGYYKILRTPTAAMEATTQLFLAIRFNCNKCHDHPFERWTQDQYHQTAAYFAQVGLQPDPESKDRTIGGSAVEGAQPFYEIVADTGQGEIHHDRTGQVTPPEFPFACEFEVGENASRRQAIAAWLTSASNPYFARSYVNRVWAYLTGVGIIQPIDDIRAGNPPSNPELLDFLTAQFIENGFDVRHIMRMICHSRTYQLSVSTTAWNADDEHNYAHAIARRLPAEVLFDAVHEVTGSVPNIPGVPAGTRATQLPDVGITLPSGFLETLGRPVRESVCECERTNDIQLGPVMAMLSGPVVSEAIADPANAITQLVNSQPDDRLLVDELFLRILNRHATADERPVLEQLQQEIDRDHQQLAAQLQAAETEWAQRKTQLDADRQQALADAQRDLAEYEQQIAPKMAELEQQRTEKVNGAAAAIRDYEAHVSERFDTWASHQAGSPEWHPLASHQRESSNGAVLRPSSDRSIRAEGNAAQGVYTLTFHTRLQGITGVRLETLPVEELKGAGPGLAENGNFVVTEFEVLVAPASAPTQWNPVTLDRPTADFTQQGFDIQQAIDGVTQDQRGWAVHPAGGTVHWATFQTKQPVGDAQGTVLQVRIHQYHEAADHRLARLRISVTTEPTPVGLSLPESLAAVWTTAADQRTAADQNRVLEYFRRSEPDYLKLQADLATAQQPVPVDPGLASRQARVQQLQKPIPDEPVLVQLRADLQQSAEQFANKRLTAAQDLTWALINSPAFLFNY
ncbi:MAG: DUF1549 domain-containing protein [Pirellulaceae bacterium]